MTRKQQDGSKDQKRLNVRLDEETNSKLDKLCEISDDTISNVVRSLIHHGTVNVITNGSQLIKCINKFNNTINQHNLQLSREIENVQTDINQIKHMLLQEGTTNSILPVYVAKAELFIDQLSRKYQEEIYRISDYMKCWR
ncbi:hypothetical protein [Dendrosporobacter sp. 1207_IL3150]|uniref:hypothetical protein n=1 Tax=Dendrosporobacter sp. 1207_IL3150 TaxID=3084054 RepID=UPI002FD96D70